ncbi:MAG: hypothetical protein NZM25_01970 [Leptospiraceae bacterium]|nr:hypothetical protein [Leptospiraceae bacterium]MDW8306943.1 hypothetical protein [Leptospiraceae bacterium]
MDVSVDKLVEKLYEEGVRRAQDEAREILQQAEQKAQQIMEEAKRESMQIRQEAEKKAKRIYEELQGELKMAIHTAIAELREKLRYEILRQSVEEPVRQDMLKDREFLKKAILIVLEKVEGDFELRVPEDLAEDLRNYFKSDIGKIFQKMEIKVEGQSKGFTIEAKERGYALEFSDDTLIAFFAKYLKEASASYLKYP